MTEVSTTWVDRDQCPQFNTGEELKGMFCQQSSKPVIKGSKEPSLNRHKKQREILGQVFCTLVSSPNAVWNLGFNFNTLFEKKNLKKYVFCLKMWKN